MKNMDFGTAAFKDHEKANFVNHLTKVAAEFGHTQQLRERLSRVVERVINKIGVAYDNKCLLCEAPTDARNWAEECDALREQVYNLNVAFMEVTGGISFDEYEALKDYGPATVVFAGAKEE